MSEMRPEVQEAIDRWTAEEQEAALMHAQKMEDCPHVEVLFTGTCVECGEQVVLTGQVPVSEPSEPDPSLDLPEPDEVVPQQESV